MKFAFTLLLIAACTAEQQPGRKIYQNVGGRCEGCELYREGIPGRLRPNTVIVNESEPGERLMISGTIFKPDGVTPAPNVILYLYHTDSKGYYSPAPHQSIARRHGHLRGWLKTGNDGKYQFTTIRPAPYPNAAIPAHIHPTVKEEDKNAYYIDDYVFEDDPLVNATYRASQELRGGSGIVKVTKDAQGNWVGERNLILGLHVPNYPK